MRELDLLLERFVSSALDELDEHDLDRLEALLERPDQDILAWLSGTSRPDDADTARIVDTMRRCLERRPARDEQ